MVRTNSLYTAAQLGWALVVFGLTAAVFSGRAAPYLTPSMLPVSGLAGFLAFPVVLIVAGVVIITRLKTQAWKRTGQRATLTPDGTSLVGYPDLVGTHDGRAVRARTLKRRTGGDGDDGSSTSTFTVVETDLEDSAEAGLVIGHREDGAPPIVDDLPVEIATASVGEFTVVGESTPLADDVLTSRARSALAEPSLNGSVLVGNAAEVLLKGVPEADGMLAGRLTDGIKHKLARAIPGDDATVRTETEGVLLDGAEMSAQVTAVTAVADSFERAIEQ